MSEGVVRYGGRSSDGMDDEHWCDGTHHFVAFPDRGRDALISKLLAENLGDEEFHRQVAKIDKRIRAHRGSPNLWRAVWWHVGLAQPNGACDGSCRATTTLDLATRVAEMRAEALHTGEPIMDGDQVVGMDGPVLPSTVELDAGALALLEVGTLTGRRIESWYGKRSDEGEIWCLGNQHLKIATQFDWWGGADNGIYKSHRLTATPCDGSCKPKAVTLTAQAAKALLAAVQRAA